jgi:polyhydroxyalkanoate synthesis regulator phasin
MVSKKNSGYNMDDWEKAVEQATTLGIGFAIVSKDALEDVIKKASKDNSVSEKEARKAVTELVKESKLREAKLKKQVAHALKVVKSKSPVVLRKEMDKLKAEIARLKENKAKKKKK